MQNQSRSQLHLQCGVDLESGAAHIASFSASPLLTARAERHASCRIGHISATARVASGLEKAAYSSIVASILLGAKSQQQPAMHIKHSLAVACVDSSSSQLTGRYPGGSLEAPVKLVNEVIAMPVKIFAEALLGICACMHLCMHARRISYAPCCGRQPPAPQRHSPASNCRCHRWPRACCAVLLGCTTEAHCTDADTLGISYLSARHWCCAGKHDFDSISSEQHSLPQNQWAQIQAHARCAPFTAG